MTIEQFTREAEALARSCVHLRPTDDPAQAIAVWRGIRGGDEVQKHVISVDRRYLPGDARDEGLLSLYIQKNGEPGALFEKGSLLDVKGGLPLAGEERRSLPPADAVFRFGSEAVGAWLRELGWERDWPPNSNFKGIAVVDAYEELWQSELPLYTGDAHALIGGWHFPWPDDDWEELLEFNLLLWTFEDAEPWFEVWWHPGSLWAIDRIT